MAAIESIDELGINAHTVTRFLNAALQDVTHSQFLPDIFDIHRFAWF